MSRSSARQAEKVIEASESQIKKRDIELERTVAQINAAKAKVLTAAQAAKALQQELSDLPMPVSIGGGRDVTAIATPVNSLSNRSGSPVNLSGGPTDSGQATGLQLREPVAVTVPQADLKPLYERLIGAETCEAELAASRADSSDSQRQLAAALQLKELAEKRHPAVTRWGRIRSASKWFSIGVGVGALMLRAAR